MANELRYRGNTGQTVKACIWFGDTRWDGSAMSHIGDITDAAWTTGMISMSEEVSDNTTPTGYYTGTFPAGITSRGDYEVTYYETATPAPGTQEDGSQQVLWDGVAEVELVTLASLLAVLAGEAQPHVIQTVTLTGTPTGGTFRLTYDGQSTSALAYNASAATVDAALEALSTIGTGNVAVTGSAGGPYTVTFGGTLDLTQLMQMSATDSLTGTNANVEVATSVRFMGRDGTTPAFLQTYGQVPGSRIGSTVL